jgi:hypothetical protein
VRQDLPRRLPPRRWPLQQEVARGSGCANQAVAGLTQSAEQRTLFDMALLPLSRRLILGALFSAAAVFACVSDTQTQPSGPEDSGLPSDSTVTPVDTALPDSGVPAEVGSSDTSTSETDAKVASGCALLNATIQPTKCFDFDSVVSVNDGWAEISRSGGAPAPELTADQAYSPGKGARFRLTGIPQSSMLSIETDIRNKAKFGFQLRVNDSGRTAGYLMAGSFTAPSAGSINLVYDCSAIETDRCVVSTSVSSTLLDGGSPGQYFNVGRFARKTWVRVETEIDFSGPMLKVTSTVATVEGDPAQMPQVRLIERDSAPSKVLWSFGLRDFQPIDGSPPITGQEHFLDDIWLKY